ncbi:MAG: hypothetical protein WBN10_05250 [Polyangiales bacterium]
MVSFAGFMPMRLLPLLFCFAFLSTPATVGAQEDERSWEEKQEGGLSASRHSVTTASVNVFLMPFSASIWLTNAPGQSELRWRRTSYAIGSATAAAAAANLGWLVVAGISLSDYRQETGEWMTLRRARTHVGFTGVDTTFRLVNLIGGAIAVSRGNGFGYSLLVTNLVFLPFHAWALSATGRELRHRKRESKPRARRVQPTGSGFRF